MYTEPDLKTQLLREPHIPSRFKAFFSAKTFIFFGCACVLLTCSLWKATPLQQSSSEEIAVGIPTFPDGAVHVTVSMHGQEPTADQKEEKLFTVPNGVTIVTYTPQGTVLPVADAEWWWDNSLSRSALPNYNTADMTNEWLRQIEVWRPGSKVEDLWFSTPDPDTEFVGGIWVNGNADKTNPKVSTEGILNLASNPMAGGGDIANQEYPLLSTVIKSYMNPRGSSVLGIPMENANAKKAGQPGVVWHVLACRYGEIAVQTEGGEFGAPPEIVPDRPSSPTSVIPGSTATSPKKTDTKAVVPTQTCEWWIAVEPALCGGPGTINELLQQQQKSSDNKKHCCVGFRPENQRQD